MGRSAQKRRSKGSSHGKRKRVRAETQPVDNPSTAIEPKATSSHVTRDDPVQAASEDHSDVSNEDGPVENSKKALDEVKNDSENSSEKSASSLEDMLDSANESEEEGDSKQGAKAQPGTVPQQEAHAEGSWPAGGPNAHITVVLECANLESIKLSGSRGGFGLLSSEDHGAMLRKMKRDPNDARPDITHQCLLTLLDSPLNKAGKLTVYLRTKRNVLISVHPQTRIPRTIRRFSGLMVELLQKFKVRSTNGTEPLLHVIRNPITSHLPAGQRRILCTYNCDNVVDVRTHAKETVETARTEKSTSTAENGAGAVDEETRVDDDRPLQVLYVVGAMAHGKVETDWTDEEICISEYPLSAATVCSRILYTYESMMGIL